MLWLEACAAWGEPCIASRLTAQPCTLSAQQRLCIVRPCQDVCPCAGNLAFVAAAAHNLHLLGAILQQACQVCSLALESIMLHCDAHQAELQQPRQISSSSSSLGLSPLVEVLLRLTGTIRFTAVGHSSWAWCFVTALMHEPELGSICFALLMLHAGTTGPLSILLPFRPCLRADPSAWQPAVGPQGAPAAAAQVLARLASRGRLFETLSRLLLTACPVLSPAQAAAPMSLAEALISNLAVRFVSLQQQARVASLASTVPQLLCAPLLWGRCPHVLLTVGARAYFCVHVSTGALLCLIWLP